MKNKEIEELLNKFKNADSQQFNELVEDFNNVYKLLSYIEQLEKENKILRENAEHNDKVVDKVNWENQQLKKQKDDVVEFIHKELDRFDCEGSMSISMRISYFEEDLLRMLGEIDETDNLQ